ncbi:MscS Mechanosensitive ion channel [Nautilia profundicola AmH]|uniref:MscS Mechanosensitive ion channel n=1 Tax=Nautilia profundicola (strain ATCC BAA-1463 / DSM 18972 / AmH) TaxID=598659 RepID=B9L8D8_NAUPA|nr:mechanosensitive ion channel domain-containing protein [Nautilia profundicola]ACM92470.1 MscS Mechanosensitive ion channel [Nautilia profundicola AmH]
MRIIVVLLFFLSLFANETNTTILKQRFNEISDFLKKDEFFINYQSYLNYKKLQNKIYSLEKLAQRNPRRYKDKLERLKTELELLSKNRNIFTTLIKIKELPKPPEVNNPFQIFSALNYEKEVDNVVNENIKTYEYFKNTLKLLQELQEINKKLNIESPELKQAIQDFIMINNIYKTKLKTLEAESKIYKQKVKKEIQKEINKLISLIISIAISIFIFMIIKFAVRRYVKEESFYLTNKILNFINATVILIIISFFYINNATYLITIVGFASAGIAIAMKDWFMNIFGWFVIMTSGNFKVGDRIKIYLQNGQVRIVGDVIDITMTRIVVYEDVTLTTYLYNRRAGRIVFIPNNVIFTNPVFNYTHHGMSTVWDGIDITITFDSNYKKAVYLAKEIVSKYSKGYTDITKRRLQKLKSAYHIRNANVEPRIYTFIEENGIRISCWYLNNYTPLNLRSNISAEIIEAFNNEEDIKIAYPTYTIVKKEENEKLNETEIPV